MKFLIIGISKTEKNTPNILVAKIEEDIVGFVTFEKAEADYFDTKIKEYGEVIELFVLEKFRKKGIGKKLLTAAEEYFVKIGLNYVELQLSVFNSNAIDFYKYMGYASKQALYFKKIK